MTVNIKMLKKLSILLFISSLSLRAMDNEKLFDAISKMCSPNNVQIFERSRALASATQTLLVQNQPITQWPDYFYTTVPFGKKIKKESKFETIPADVCAICEKDRPGKKCSACKLVRYCSPYCQKKDWQAGSHKDTCKELQALSLEDKEIYDWIYALKRSEKTLLKKPFEWWTLDDINKINSMVCRFTGSQPGVMRALGTKTDTEIVPFWKKRKLNDEEDARLERIRQSVVKTVDDFQFLKQVAYIFPEPERVHMCMKSLIETASVFLKDDKKTPDNQKRALAIIKTAAYVHFEMMRIHPWKEGNKRTALLVMNIILAQAGFDPIDFEYDNDALIVTSGSEPMEKFDTLYAMSHSDRYIQLLLKALDENRSTPVSEHLVMLLRLRQAKKNKNV